MKSKKEKYCLNPSCKKELIHTEGRRPKKYCNPACRISHHLAKKKEPRYVQLETHNKVKKQLDELLFKSMDKSLNPDLRTNSGMVTVVDIEVPKETEIQAQIKLIRAEKIPAYRDTPIGRKSWLIDQQKRISELQQKLNTQPPSI